LALSNIIDISVTVSPSSPSVNPFNIGLFIGPSTTIPSYGANSRVQYFTSPADVLAAGFSPSSPEYIAAQIYFSQLPAAAKFALGRQDLTALQTITIDVAGTGYAVGDTFTVTQGGANYGTGKVTAATGGVPSAITVVSGQQGTGYTVANGLATVAVSPATGTDLEIDITAVGESLLQAATACRAVSGLWYGLTVNAPGDTDNLAISEWADPQWQSTRYYPFSLNTAIPAGTTGNIALQLQTLKLKVLGQYATTQSGLYPNNIYAAVALMGVEMGLQTGLPNSFFTVAHKTLVGIAPEPLTQSQYQAILSAGFNVYGNFGAYQLEEPGFMSDGSPSYLWLYLAVLVAELQNTEMAVLQGNPAVAQTNAAQQLLIQAANEACAVLSAIGFLASAAWEGAPVNIPGVSMQVGQAVPGGYLNQSQPYSQQSLANRDAGQAMPIFSFVTTAGAVQSLMIAVYVEL
jgi:hypothetical protein